MFDPETAEIRFGTGLSPHIKSPENITAMLNGLTGPDAMAKRFPIGGFDLIEKALIQARANAKKRRENPDMAEELLEERRLLRRKMRFLQYEWMLATLARGVFTDDGLRERLVRFWADHFTVKSKQAITRSGVSAYAEQAIRPHIAGRFGDLLKSAITHPMMLVFLDQQASIGPNSVRALRKSGGGLNENLAREVLELHTLGVGGAYSQTDVRELAKLFAGMSYKRGRGFVYKVNMAEPGAKNLLGKTYGAAKPKFDHIAQFLNDLAIHPDTARHLARKLVVHFVSDTPDAGLVEHMAQVYLDSHGDLLQTYRAMLEHPAAWAMPAAKVKQPDGFMVSSLRALGVHEAVLIKASKKHIRNHILAPLGLMGQPWQDPIGPDGWPEAAEHWVSPQGLAARIQWAMNTPAQAMRRSLPDPRIFIDTALGKRASEQLRFAVSASESKAEGVGLVLASPEFQRL